jgi:hypothetical protein
MLNVSSKIMDFDTYKMDGDTIGKTDNIYLSLFTALVIFIGSHTIDISDDICIDALASPLLSIYDNCDDAQFERSSQ